MTLLSFPEPRIRIDEELAQEERSCSVDVKNSRH